MSFIKKLFAIIEKNLRQLVHSKSSALIILISPIILMALAGLALSTSGLSGVKVGVYAPGETNIEGVLNTKMADKGFSITQFASLQACKDAVTNEETHICVEVAKKEDQSSASLDPRLGNKVNFYVDYSKVRLVWAIVNVIRTIVAEESLKITTQITGKLSSRIQEAIDQIQAQKGNIDLVMNQAGNIRNKGNEARSYVNQMGNVLNGVQGTVNSINIALNDVTNNANNMFKDLGYLCNSIDSASTSLPEPYSASLINQCRNTQGGFNSYIETINRLVSNIRSNQQQVQSTIDSAKRSQQDAQAVLNDLNSQLDYSLNQLQTLKSQVDIATNQMSWAQNIKAEDIVNPIPVEILPVTGDVNETGSVSSALTYLDYLLPALLILVVMFVSTLIASTIVIKERKSNAYFRNIISPTNGSLFLFGVYLIGLILVALQSLLLILVAVFFFGFGVSSPLSISLVVLFIISIFTLFGIIIGYLFNSEETSMMGAISLTLIFLLFSTLIIPLETMPAFMRSIAQFSPFIIGEVALRKIMIFDIPLMGCINEIIELAIIFAIVLAIALLVQFWKKRKEI